MECEDVWECVCVFLCVHTSPPAPQSLFLPPLVFCLSRLQVEDHKPPDASPCREGVGLSLPLLPPEVFARPWNQRRVRTSLPGQTWSESEPPVVPTVGQVSVYSVCEMLISSCLFWLERFFLISVLETWLNFKQRLKRSKVEQYPSVQRVGGFPVPA